MDLGTLARRLEHEVGGEHKDAEVLILAPGGRRYDLLSLNWDKERGCWVLVGDRGDS
jgi:hypothetical protein